MSQPVAYKNGSAQIPGSIMPPYSTVFMGISDNSSVNYTGGYGSKIWRNGVEMNGSYWIVYSDNYSQGMQVEQSLSEPVAWVTDSLPSSGNNWIPMIDLVNRLPSRMSFPKLDTIEDAMLYLVNDGRYFPVNYKYPSLYFDGKSPIYMVDPTFIASYPLFGTSLYDLTNNSGPTQLSNSSLSYFYGAYYLDGSDGDYAIIPSGAVQNQLAGKTSATVSVWFKFNSPLPTGEYALFAIHDNGVTVFPNREWLYLSVKNTGADNDVNLDITCNMDLGPGLSGRLNNQFTIDSTLTSWYNLTLVIQNSGFTAYINGLPLGFLKTGPSGLFASGTPAGGSIGTNYYSGSSHNDFPGNIGAVHVWNSALTSSEVLSAYSNIKVTGLYP